jgi:ribosomal protein S18 acetylase RimI-like enzyme
MINTMSDKIETSIRQATIADLDELLSLSKQTFFDAFAALNHPDDMQAYADIAFTRGKFESEINDPDSEFYFAVYQNTNIGYIKLNFRNAQTEFQDANALEIERIYVSAAYQNKQIGQFLLDHTVEIAHREKLKYIWLGVFEKNANAIRFYQRNGFEKFSTHYFMLGSDKQTDLLLKKTLSH